MEKARLRSSVLSRGPLVALKRLRSTGNREQRIRVLAVRTLYRTVGLPSPLTALKSLARELVVWNELKHPNILRLEGFYFEESSLKSAWIATLWQPQGNVLQYIASVVPSVVQRIKLVSNRIPVPDVLLTITDLHYPS